MAIHLWVDFEFIPLTTCFWVYLFAMTSKHNNFHICKYILNFLQTPTCYISSVGGGAILEGDAYVWLRCIKVIDYFHIEDVMYYWSRIWYNIDWGRNVEVTTIDIYIILICTYCSLSTSKRSWVNDLNSNYNSLQEYHLVTKTSCI